MKYSLAAFMCLITFCLAAQPAEKELKKHHEKIAKSKAKGSTVLSLDTVFLAGEPYCILKTTKKALGTPHEQKASALNGEGILLISLEMRENNSEYYWKYQFMDAGEVAEFSFGTGTDAEENLTKYEIYHPEGINEKGVRLFVKANPSRDAKRTLGSGKAEVDDEDEMLVRNRNTAIMVFGNAVKQDNKTIATVAKTQEATGGTIVQKIIIYNHNENKIASAEGQGAVANEWVIITRRDGRKHQVTTATGMEVRDIVSYLVSKYYL